MGMGPGGVVILRVPTTLLVTGVPRRDDYSGVGVLVQKEPHPTQDGHLWRERKRSKGRKRTGRRYKTASGNKHREFFSEDLPNGEGRTPPEPAHISDTESTLHTSPHTMSVNTGDLEDGATREHKSTSSLTGEGST